MGAHNTPAVLHGHGGSLDGLSDGTNLVNLEQQSVASLLLDTGGDTGRCRKSTRLVSWPCSTLHSKQVHINLDEWRV